jgi:DNA polymerase I
MDKFLLIDAHSLLHRAYHALPPLTSPTGKPSGALYGAASVILRLLKDENPTYVAACFDTPAPTFRKQKYEAYKAHRPKTEETLASQLREAPDFFRAMGLAVVECPGFEGDDIIATLASKFCEEIPVEILTGDLDSLQLVSNGKIMVRTFGRGVKDMVNYDEQKVFERLGVWPFQVCDYKAIVGDVSDNVPGVAGVGPKTASLLIGRYKNLAGILKAAEDSKAARIIENKDVAILSRELVVLNKDAPVPGDLDFFKTKQDKESLRNILSSYGLESLIGRYIEDRPVVSKKTTPSSTVAKKITARQLGGLFEERQSVLLEDNEVEEDLEVEVLGIDKEDAQKTKIGFFLKEAIKENTEIHGKFYDIGVAYWLADSDLKDYSPEFLSQFLFKEEFEFNKKNILRLYARSRKILSDKGTQGVMENIEMPLLPVLAKMEMRGIAVDKSRLIKIQQKAEIKVGELRAEIESLAGKDFNPNSPLQVGNLLFDKLKLTSRGKRSTSFEKLDGIKDEHPIVVKILEYREQFKALSTYIIPLQEHIQQDGRIHTEFLQTAAATGRLSSRNPNLQNISKDTAWGKELRESFVSGAGFTLLSLDYSQIELRVLAVLAGDRGLLDAFAAGKDVHAATASKIFKKDITEVSEKERAIAKSLNFGLMYGMGPVSFAKSAGVSRTQAKDFIKEYFEAFPGIRAWQEEARVFARKHGYVETLSGRRRHLHSINQGSPEIIAENERQAINHPVQGLGADLIKSAMIKCEAALSEKFKETEARMILTVHDELLFEVKTNIIKEVASCMASLMVSVGDPYKLKLSVSVKAGENWGQQKTLNIE